MSAPKNNTPELGTASKPTSEEESLRKLQEIFASIDKKKLVTLLSSRTVKKRPSRWSGLTIAPYYKERYALELRAIIDKMMEEFANNELIDREWKYKDFVGIAYSTLYNRINQSKLYLLEEMDIDGTYKAFFSLLSITRERTGVRLSYNRDVRLPETAFTPSPVIPKAETPRWKQELDDFLNTGKEGEQFIKKNLSLNEDNIRDLEISLSNIKGILFNIDPDYIKVVKIPLKQWEMLQ